MQGDTGSLQDLKRYHLEHHNVPKTIYEEGNPPGVSENANGKVQGSLLSGIDNKTVRRLGIEKRIVVQGPSNRLTYTTDQVQLNKYETAPNFIQLTQNLTSDCLFVDLAVFTSSCMM